jgi:hypothetical protein
MLFFLTFISNAQNFIETLKGERFDNIDELEVEITFDKIFFNYNGKKESIKVQKIKNAILGEYRLENHKINEKDNFTFFVYSENNDKRLLCLIEKHNVQNNISSSTWSYHRIFILDNENKILEDLSYRTNLSSKKLKDKADKAEKIIKESFKDCSDFKGRFEKYNLDNSEFQVKSKKMQKKIDQYNKYKNEFIFSTFLEQPKYSNCKQ